MIVKEALKSVWTDKFRSFFFWLTFLLTTFFIFIFFTLSYEVGEESIMTFVTVFMVLVCTMDIFFVNHFYMVSKAKDLAVRLICGATYTYLSFYLLIQVVFLLFLALPLGLWLGIRTLPLFAHVIGMNIAVSSDAIMRISVMIGYIIFWILLFNLSFTYKSAASMMFNMQSETVSGKSDVLSLHSGHKFDRIKKMIMPILEICPLVLLMDKAKPAVFCTGFGTVLLYFFFDWYWVPALNEKIDHSGIENGNALISIGFHRMNIRKLKTNILLLNGASLLVYGLVDQSTSNSVCHITVILSFVMISILLWLAFLFQYETEQFHREKYLNILLSIGYTKQDLKKILHKEVLLLFGSVLLLEMLYFIPVTLSHLNRGVMNVGEVLFAVSGYLVPFIGCLFISYVTYDKILSGVKTRK